MNWKKIFLNFFRYAGLLTISYFLSREIGYIWKYWESFGYFVISISFLSITFFLFLGDKKWKYWWSASFFLIAFVFFVRIDLEFALIFTVIPSLSAFLIWLLVQGLKKVFKNNRTQI